MANLIIKPSAGGDLVIKSSDDSPAITVGTTGQATFAEAATMSGNVTMSGTANNLGTVTAGNIDAVADVVLINSGAIGSVTGIDVQQCFTSTYKFYKLYIGDYSAAAGYLLIGFLSNSNSAITDTYYTHVFQAYTASSQTGTAGWTTAPAGGQNPSANNSTAGFKVQNGWTFPGGSLSEGGIFEMQFYDPNNTNKTHVQGSLSIRDTGYVMNGRFNGMCNTSSAVYGLQIKNSDGNFNAKGHWAVYGYKI